MKNEFLDGLISQEVLLKDPLTFFLRDVVIPNPFRIDDKNRPALTNAEAVALAPVDPIWTFTQTQLLEPLLEMRIKSRRTLRCTARTCADEDVLSVRF